MIRESNMEIWRDREKTKGKHKGRTLKDKKSEITWRENTQREERAGKERTYRE